MNVKYDHAGKRFRKCRDALSIMQEEEKWDDWPIKGPRTTRWCVNHMVTHAGTPKGWHQRWMTEMKLTSSDPGVDVHELCCTSLELLLTYEVLRPRSFVVTYRCRKRGTPTESTCSEMALKSLPSMAAWALEETFASAPI